MRETKARQSLIQIIKQTSFPVSARELQNLLNVNKTTIYRQIEFLKRENLVREINFGDGKIRYERVDEECHHHVVCGNCGKIEDVRIEERTLIQTIEKQSNFKIDKHSIEFMGLCASCQ